MSLLEACQRIERNEPPIHQFAFINTWREAHDFLTAEVRLNEGSLLNAHLSYARDDVQLWSRLGRAINVNPTLHNVNILDHVADSGAPHPAALETDLWHTATACVEALCRELKNNNSIHALQLVPICQVHPFDLEVFLQKNSNLKNLMLKTYHHMTIAPAVTNALSAYLQDPTTILRDLFINFDLWGGDFDKSSFLTTIAQSLRGNTTLKKLELDLKFGPDEVLDHFDNMLCDSSSLDSICNSNHTIESICLDTYGFSNYTEECLMLNKNANKVKVIQDKIMKYYFVESFDLAPFANMPLSVLAQVMSLGREPKDENEDSNTLLSMLQVGFESLDDEDLDADGVMSNKQNAIFELLRGIPELCNVSSRRVPFKHVDVLDTGCNKRQKRLFEN
jgi:hypothetical protein